MVVNGDAYLINTLDAQDWGRVNVGGPTTEMRAAKSAQTLVLASPWAMTGIRAHGQIWVSPRLAIERLEIIEVTGGVIRGQGDAADGGPTFTIDLFTGEVLTGRAIAIPPAD